MGLDPGVGAPEVLMVTCDRNRHSYTDGPLTNRPVIIFSLMFIELKVKNLVYPCLRQSKS